MTGRSIIRNSLAVSFGSIFSVFTALGATVLIAGTYGLSAEADAYFVAIILSNLANMILQSSVSPVLVPAISQANFKGAHIAGDRLMQTLLSLGLAVGLVLFTILSLGAAPIIELLAPGFDEETSQIATQLFRYACVGIALAFPSEVLRSYLNTKGAFGWPAAAEALRTGSIIVSIVVLSAGWGIRAAIIGFALGHILQFAVLLVLAIAMGLKPKVAFDIRDPHLRSFLHQLRYPIMGVSFITAPFLLQRFLLSMLEPGTLAMFSLAQQIMFMLLALTLKGVSTATHPVVSRHAAENDADSMNDTLVRGLKLSALLGCTAFAFAAILNWDAFALIGGFRSFTNEDAVAISFIFLVLSSALPVNGLAQILRLPLYAQNNARVPAWHMVVMGIIHVLAQLALFRFYGVFGIAVAQAGSVWSIVITCFFLLPAGSKSVVPRSAPTLVKIVLACLIFGFLAYRIQPALSPLSHDSGILVRLVWMSALTGATTVIALIVFRLCIMADYEDVFGVRDYKALIARIAARFVRPTA
ncbi:MAG: putative lipid II flippase MurJ [Phycisphaerae bacterium]|nr:MAG: putative lipid II flippase MurJ [Phycisphaerae bacterium]